MPAISPVAALGGVSPISPTGPIDAAAAPLGANGITGAGRANGLDALLPTSGAQPADGAGSFVDAIGDAFSKLNTQLTTADASMASFASGGSADLHTVMLQMQEASLGLKMGLQVRDRLLEAYHEIMRMQV